MEFKLQNITIAAKRDFLMNLEKNFFLGLFQQCQIALSILN
jgi:hypothetical protein